MYCRLQIHFLKVPILNLTNLPAVHKYIFNDSWELVSPTAPASENVTIQSMTNYALTDPNITPLCTYKYIANASHDTQFHSRSFILQPLQRKKNLFCHHVCKMRLSSSDYTKGRSSYSQMLLHQSTMFTNTDTANFSLRTTDLHYRYYHA
jgi:hypothetical protein